MRRQNTRGKNMKHKIFIQFFIWLFHLTYLRESRLIAWRDVVGQDSTPLPPTQNLKNPMPQKPQNLTPKNPMPKNLKNLKAPPILPHTQSIKLDPTCRYLALLSHRNGALDGWVYGRFIPRFVYMMARQLHRFWWLRAIFPGIAITRQKDDPAHYKKANLRSIKACVQALQERKILCVFPEGTSTLKHRHLPFEQGAARLALMSQKAALESAKDLRQELSQKSSQELSGVDSSKIEWAKSHKIESSGAKAGNAPLYILPMSVFYDDPALLGGRAFVVYDEPFLCPSDLDLPRLHALFTHRLERILLEYESQEQQELSHFFASFLSANTAFSDYYANLVWLKNLQNAALDSHNSHRFEAILHLIQTYRKSPLPALYKRAPIYPQSLPLSLWTFSICLPVVALSLALNLLPLLCGYLAAKCFAKESHTISLWKAIVGYGVGFIWWGGVLLASGLGGAFAMGRDFAGQAPILDSLCGGGGGILCALAACGLGLWGLKLYGALKKHTIALYNACFHRKKLSKYQLFKTKLLEILR